MQNTPNYHYCTGDIDCLKGVPERRFAVLDPEAERQALLDEAARKASPRRFTNEAITGFGALA